MELLGISLILILVIALSLFYVNYTAKFENVPEGYRSIESGECEKVYQSCINDGGLVKDCTSDYNKCITENVTSKNTGEVKDTKQAEINADYTALASAALSGQTNAYLTPAFQEFMKQVQSKVSVEYPAPGAVNLELAQGGGINPSGETTSDVYTTSQTIIKPHEDLPKEKSSLTPQQPNAPDIPLTQASLRQQIRDDIKKAVKEEIDTIDNEYEIKYVTQ